MLGERQSREIGAASGATRQIPQGLARRPRRPPSPPAHHTARLESLGGPLRRSARSLLAGLLLLGCSVDVPRVLDDGFFVCSSPPDCGPGQGCAEGNVYSADFCRPACDLRDPSTCPDGVCTVRGACLTGCSIDEDGNPSDCPGDEFTCVRIDAFRDEGVCYPVEGCSRTTDCRRDGRVRQLCLNEALGLPARTIGAGVRFDNLYCTAAPDGDGRCPPGYLSFTVSDGEGRRQNVCYPPCMLGGDGPFCPPATTCFRGFGELVGLPGTPPCLPGVWGLPCEDDTHCIAGRCLDVGGGARACTETCEQATSLVGGCPGLEQVGAAFGVYTRMTCERVQGVDTCVPRYDLLSLCDEQLECAGGPDVRCSEVTVEADTRAHVCLRFCSTDAECATATGGDEDDYRCAETPEGGSRVCVRRRRLGARCSMSTACAEGLVCCELGGFGACLATCPP